MPEKSYFAGSNSALGFSSYFDGLMDPARLNSLYILKGGPGVGKSSFMKKFGAAMRSAGYEAEFIHCSSDHDSLDGILIKDIKVMLVDGTAPHMVDPRLPGAADQIINLGAYLDGSALKSQKQEIIDIGAKKSDCYQSAYRYLSGAGTLFRENLAIYERESEKSLLDAVLDETVYEIFKGVGKKTSGLTRKFFTESYTSNGFISYTESFCAGNRVLNVIGKNASAISRFLTGIADEAARMGLDTDRCCLPLFPDMLQHLYIPELRLMLKSCGGEANNHFHESINLDRTIRPDVILMPFDEIEENRSLFNTLINKALNKLKEAKYWHSELEKIYVGNMDFSAVDECFEKLIAQYR